MVARWALVGRGAPGACPTPPPCPGCVRHRPTVHPLPAPGPPSGVQAARHPAHCHQYRQEGPRGGDGHPRRRCAGAHREECELGGRPLCGLPVTLSGRVVCWEEPHGIRDWPKHMCRLLLCSLGSIKAKAALQAARARSCTKRWQRRYSAHARCIDAATQVLWPANNLLELPPPSGNCVHVVKAGDTLFQVAKVRRAEQRRVGPGQARAVPGFEQAASLPPLPCRSAPRPLLVGPRSSLPPAAPPPCLAAAGCWHHCGFPH